MRLPMCQFVRNLRPHEPVTCLSVREGHFLTMPYDTLFDRLEVDAAPFALCTLEGRTDLGLGKQSRATLHYILSGTGEVLLKGRPGIPVAGGTLVLVPACLSHGLRSHGGNGTPLPKCQAAELGFDLHERRSPTDPGGALLALCSHVTVGLRSALNLVDLIREPIAVTVQHNPAMAGTVDRLVEEVTSPRTGSRAMIRALLLECMLHLLRNRLEAEDPALAWMRGLHDPGLWQALQDMLDQPGADHSVESLAATAGMSRSTFSDRFQAAYSHGPMALLRLLRMRRAAQLLEQSSLPISRIAELVGFRSRSAFSRAFQSSVGVCPRRFRDGIS